MKNFLITIDTEGDNLWGWRDGDKISTENSIFLPRFQALCDKYGMKPVYLTNYEMASDQRFVSFAKATLRDNRCEIGMHLHAYNNPPFFPLKVKYSNNFPYLIEYPTEIIQEKVSTITYLLEHTFETKINSHRAGRWATDDRYLDILAEHHYSIDCSVTPGVNWKATGGATEGSTGSDYSAYPTEPFFIRDNILEVPVTIRKVRKSFDANQGNLLGLARKIKHSLLGQHVWIRPNGKNIKELEYLLESVSYNDSDYVMFMLHSSELMPGGNPIFRTAEDIENLYKDIEKVFALAAQFCVGKTLSEYAEEYKK